MLDVGRVLLAADTFGAAQTMLDQAVAYSLTREQFNRPIGSFQAVKHMCAEMAAGLEPCQSLVWYAAHAVDSIPDEARVTACHAKAHVAEVGKFVAKTATEVHGGMGFTDLLGLHYWFKRDRPQSAVARQPGTAARRSRAGTGADRVSAGLTHGTCTSWPRLNSHSDAPTIGKSSILAGYT